MIELLLLSVLLVATLAVSLGAIKGPVGIPATIRYLTEVGK